MSDYGDLGSGILDIAICVYMVVIARRAFDKGAKGETLWYAALAGFFFCMGMKRLIDFILLKGTL